MHAKLQQADGVVVAEKGVHCCYAKSDKYWVTDPQGVAWESFRSLGAIPLFGEDSHTAPGACGTNEGNACCAPRLEESQSAKGAGGKAAGCCCVSD
jgi:hypothetical protein